MDKLDDDVSNSLKLETSKSIHLNSKNHDSINHNVDDHNHIENNHHHNLKEEKDFQIHYSDTHLQNEPSQTPHQSPTKHLKTNQTSQTDSSQSNELEQPINQTNHDESNKTTIKLENGKSNDLKRLNEFKLIDKLSNCKSVDKSIESKEIKESKEIEKTLSNSDSTKSTIVNKSLDLTKTKSIKSSVKLSCSKCKKKQTSNVRIQCKMDQYLASKLSSMRKELSLSFKIPRLPLPSSDLSHLKFAKFYHTEQHSNGGGLILKLYWDEIVNLTEQDKSELAIEFLKESFKEEPVGVAKYVISIVHNAAYQMPDFLDYMADTQPTLIVKSGIIGHSGSDIETTTMAAYRESVEKSYLQGTFRTGPLHQVSVVGVAHEEVCCVVCFKL